MSDLTPGERIVLKSADRTGHIVADDSKRRICRRLARAGYLNYKHGMIYELTSTGKRAKGQLK